MTNQIFVGRCDVGQGVFAERDFAEGEVILVFSGKTIMLEEAIAMGENECNPLQIGSTLYLDLIAPAVYLNHSCDPNAGIDSQLRLIAIRAIQRGEEIRYDYSTSMSERRWTMQCTCGSIQCRRTIQDFHFLTSEVKQRYLHLKIVVPFIVLEHESRAVSHEPLPTFSNGRGTAI